MKKRTVVLFIIAPMIYFLIGSFFLFKHLTQQESFSRVIGNIEVTGKTTVETRLSDPSIKKLNVDYNGVEISFRSGKQLEIVTEDEIHHKLPLVGYSFENNRLTLYFKYDVVLEFIPDVHSQEVIMRSEIPMLIPEVKTVILPLTVQNDYTLQDQNRNGTEWIIGNEEFSYFMATPPDSAFLGNASTLQFRLGSPLGNDIVISPERGSGKTALTWYEQEASSLPQNVYLEKLEDYWKISYTGWQQRFDNRNGQWSFEGGQTRYSEPALAAYLAESVRNGQYTRVQNQAMGAFDRDTTLLTLLTAPYLDNIIVRTERADRANRSTISEINEKLDNNDLTVFKDPDLYQFVEDFGPYYKMSELAELATTLVNSEPDLTTALDGLEFLLDARESGNPIEGDSEVIDYLEQQLLLPKILWIGDGLFIFNEQGNADLYETIRCGSLFQRAAEQYNKEMLLAVGHKMILSGLHYANGNSGILPDVLFFDGMDVSAGTYNIYPEDIYNLIRTHNQISRRISLGEELGQGSWMLTAAPKATVSHTPRETRISIDFNRGEPHHFIIRGIKPFERIVMHGIKWNTDRRFEQYSDGWFYDESTETLYVKITHRAETENIQIIY